MFIGIGSTPIEVGQKAPDFALPSVTGEKVSLKNYLGKKVFLFFFRGTWCPNCVNHMKAINSELAFLRESGVEILGICCQGLEPMYAFLKKENLQYKLLSDKDRNVAKEYGVYTLLSWDSINIARPSFFFIDEQGIIRYRYIGEHQWDRPNMTDVKKLADPRESNLKS